MTMTPKSTGAFVRSAAVVLFFALGWRRQAQAFSVHRLGAGGIQRSHHRLTASAHRRSSRSRSRGHLFLGSSSPNESNAQPTKEEGALTNHTDYTPPKFEKEEDEVAFLARTLLTNFMFDSLPDATLRKLAQAFEEVNAEKGTDVIRQGDTGIDFFYVLRSGECSVTIDGKRLPDPYGTMAKGTIFGELGMLYDNPRAATVSATKDCKLYRLDRQAFRHFLDDQHDKDKEELKEELKKIDVAIDKIAGVKSKYSGDIMRQFRTGRFWLWRQWSGTVLQHTYKPALINMAITAFISLLIRRRADCNWGRLMAPDQSHCIISRMATFGKGWHYIMSLTTFILTFFLSQSYGLWREIYTSGRVIQGRLNDVGLILATSADRDEDGRYTPAARGAMDGVARAQRLFHTFAWASFTKCFGVLLTPRGMSRMLGRGLMTRSEYVALQGTDARSAGAQNACLEWMLVRALRGLKEKDGGIGGGEAAEHVLLSKVCELRGTCAGIGDVLEGRMPLAYAHFVQILVDTFLATAPVALYAEMGIWSVFSVGALTLFYSGLLSLSKIFLDPLGNEEYFNESVNCDIGVLIRESNAGSTRWKEGISTMPA